MVVNPLNAIFMCTRNDVFTKSVVGHSFAKQYDAVRCSTGANRFHSVLVTFKKIAFICCAVSYRVLIFIKQSSYKILLVSSGV